MRQILLLLENELLAQLYKTNLSVYLESQITYCKSYQIFHDKVKSPTNFDLIVSQVQFDNVNMRKEFEELFQENNKRVPVILVGDNHESDENYVAVKDFFNIPMFLSSAAKVLNVTAQMMASFQVPEYYPIDIEFIYYLKHAPTSLYIELNSEYVLFASLGTSIEEVAHDLKSEGVTHFYVKSIERLEVVKQITEILKNGLMQSTKLTPVQKIEFISNGFDYFINNLVSPQAGQEIAHLANVCIRAMSDLAAENPDFETLFLMFKNSKNNYAYIHTMLGTYVSTHIVRNLPWGGENQVDKLNYVFFFHDIYLMPIFAKYPNIQNEEELLNSAELTRQEKHTVMNHARMASELVCTFKRTPIGCDQLIKQHHGMSSGVGFAEEFKDDVSPLSKILIVTEAFVDYFIRWKENYPTQPIDIIEAIQFLNEKFKKNSYKKIVETLLTLKI